MIRYSILTVAICACYALPAAGQQAKATYVDAAKVASGGTFVTTPTHNVQMIRRTEPGQVEVHAKETDIFYVVDGEATFVTGGTMVDGKQTQPNQLRGTSINGGETHRLKKGDAIVVPAGVPHWFKEVVQPIQYFTVKVIAP